MSYSTMNPSVQTEQLSYASRPLKYIDEIRTAQQLVYQIYVEELGWNPEQNNPSRIEFIHWYQQPLFVDAFDCIASWFGTFHGDKLVACWRFCNPRNQQFELELYHSLPEFLKTARSLEVTRLAIHPNYRNRTRVIFDLVRETYRHLHQDYDYIFAAVTFPYPGNLYLKLGLQRVDVPPFKYADTDPNEVSLIYLDLKDQTTLASGFEHRRKRVQAS